MLPVMSMFTWIPS